jgi:hypothetical protein
LGDLIQKAAGEYISEIGNLELEYVRGLACLSYRCQNRLTWRVFFASRTLASASQASTPSVLPSSRISSTSCMVLRSMMWGSKSAAVSSFRPLPSKEKILVDVAMVAKVRTGNFFWCSALSKGRYSSFAIYF